MGHHIAIYESLEEVKWQNIGVKDHVIFDSLFLNDRDIIFLEKIVEKTDMTCLLHLPTQLESRADLRILRKCRIIGTGDETKKYLTKNGLWQEKKCKIITPAVRQEWRRKKSYKKKPKNILVVSNLIERKRILSIIDVLRRLKDLTWECRILGNESLDPEYTKKVKQKIKKYGLQEKIHIGQVPNGQLNDVYLESDLMVNFSAYESYGMAIAEAIASGLPVISTKVGNVAEFQHNGSVFWVDVDDHDGLEKILRTTLTSEKAYQKMIAQCGKTPVRKWQKTAEEVEQMLRKGDQNIL